MDVKKGRTGRPKLTASERRAKGEENNRIREEKKRKREEEKKLKLGESSKPQPKKLSIKLRKNTEKEPTVVGNETENVDGNGTENEKESEDQELSSTPREQTPVTVANQPIVPSDVESREESSCPAKLKEKSNPGPSLNENSPTSTPTTEVAILGGMPTPRDHDPDSIDRIGSDDERRIREELRRGKPTIGGKRLANMSPPANWEGPSADGDEEDLVEDEENLEEEEEELPEEDGEELVEEDMEDLADEEKEDKKGTNDKDWRLFEGCEGGPSNPELLRGFVGHVSYALWNGKERAVLKGVVSYERGISKWIRDLTLLPDVAELVEKSGVLCLNELMYRKINMPLVSAFVERWHPETNSFHFSFGEMTILLHDVAYAKDLPITGKLVEDKLTVPTLKKKFGTLLGADPVSLSKEWKSGCVRFTYIQKKLRSLYLYPKVGVASRFQCKEVAGCLSMLQTWIYAYFPCFRPKGRADWEEGMVWTKKWENKHTKYPEDALMTIRRKLDGLTVDDVEWTPFNPTPGEVHKISLFRGILQFRHITEPYMPDRCLRQFGYIQTIPADPFIPSVKELRYKPNAYKLVFNETNQYESFESHCVSLEGKRLVSRKGEYADDYMEWFLERTHVRVNPTMPQSPRSYELEASEAKLESIVDLFYEAHPSIRPDDVDPQRYVELVDKLCLDLLGSRFAARGVGKGCDKGSGKRKRGD